MWHAALVASLLLFPIVANAANRCTQTATGTCATRHDTVQEAADAASATTLDRIVVGPGTYVETVTLPVRVNATFQPGAVLYGEWHDAHFGVHELRTPHVYGQLHFHPGAGRNKVVQGKVTCVDNEVGIVLDSVDNIILDRVEVTGCAVGVDNLASFGTYANKLNVHENGVGIRVQGTGLGEQYFYNVLTNNVVGVQIVGASHTDINSNTVTCAAGGVGFQMDTSGPLANTNMEYNWNQFAGCRGQHWQIQQCGGGYTSDPTLSPESSAQYGGNKADGVPLPNYTTPPSPGC